jgi:hypothetical protein
MSNLRWSGQSSHEKADINLSRSHTRLTVAVATATSVHDNPAE